MTEPFYIVTILLSFILLSCMLSMARKVYLSGVETVTRNPVGLSLGATVLFRQIFLLFLPFLFVWALWSRRKQAGKASLLPLAISVSIVLVAVLPFTFYNYAASIVLCYSIPTLAMLSSLAIIRSTARNLFHPTKRVGRLRCAHPKELYGMDEAALDQELLRRGLNFVRDDPKRYILLSASRIRCISCFGLPRIAVW